MRQFMFSFGMALLVSAFVLFAVFPFSCRLTENGISLVTSDLTAPEVLSFQVTGSSSLQLCCSERVALPEASVAQAGREPFSCAVAYSDDGRSAFVQLPQETRVGEPYTFLCTVQDSAGNTLTYSRPFTGYNAKPARLLLSEVRFGHSAASAKSRKAEFVELYVLSGGNTAGLLLLGGYYSKSYAFPVMEVAAGEYITLHLRSYYDDCTDELESDWGLASSSPDATESRDLWIPGDESFMTKTDLLVLQNDADGSLMDVLLFRESAEKTAWTRTRQRELAAASYASGLWPEGETPEAGAESTSGVTRSLSRQNIPDLAAAGSSVVGKDSSGSGSGVSSGGSPGLIPASRGDWQVTATSTPGKANALP